MSRAAVNVGGWCRLAGMEVLVTLHDENMMRMRIINDGVIMVMMVVVLGPCLNCQCVLICHNFVYFVKTEKCVFFCEAPK